MADDPPPPYPGKGDEKEPIHPVDTVLPAYSSSIAPPINSYSSPPPDYSVQPPGHISYSTQPVQSYQPTASSFHSPQSGFPPSPAGYGQSGPVPGYPPQPAGYSQSTAIPGSVYYQPGQSSQIPGSLHYPPSQSQGRLQTTGVVLAQPLTTTAAHLRDRPTTLTCPGCHKDIVSDVSFEPGACTCLACVLCCVCGCDMGCCFLPFCLDEFKDAVHRCPYCSAHLGTWYRM